MASLLEGCTASASTDSSPANRCFIVKRDASKVALMALVELMRTSGMSLLDVQWCTDHLASLGAVAIARQEYLARLADAVEPTRGQHRIVAPASHVLDYFPVKKSLLM